MTMDNTATRLQRRNPPTRPLPHASTRTNNPVTQVKTQQFKVETVTKALTVQNAKPPTEPTRHLQKKTRGGLGNKADEQQPTPPNAETNGENTDNKPPQAQPSVNSNDEGDSTAGPTTNDDDRPARTSNAEQNSQQPTQPPDETPPIPSVQIDNRPYQQWRHCPLCHTEGPAETST